MDSVMFLQAAMEASAMPPPAPKANGNDAQNSGDASFDSVLEKAMKPEDDVETLALATEGVVVPGQPQIVQPVVKSDEAKLSAEASTASQELVGAVDGQTGQSQPVMIAFDEKTDATAFPQMDLTVPSSGEKQASSDKETRVAGSETPSQQGAYSIEGKSAPRIVDDKTAVSMDSRSAQAASSETSYSQQVLDSRNYMPVAIEIETTQPELSSELQRIKPDGEGNLKAVIEIDKANVPSKADTTHPSEQAKTGMSTAGETGENGLNIDAAKTTLTGQSGLDSIAAQASSSENTSTGAETQDTTNPTQTPVLESRKVKAEANKLAGESPPQATSAYGNVHLAELDVQVKEPARLAEARTPEIINQITKGIDLLSRADGQSLRIHLQPENLGRIDIRLSSGPEGVSVALNTENPMTGSLLERSLSELRTSLADAGINLANLSVNSGHSQSAYQGADQRFSGIETKKTHYHEDFADNEEASSLNNYIKETEIDYRI